MNGQTTKVEQFNNLVRGSTTLILVLVFCYLSIREVIDGQVFAQTVASVIAFWFASRGQTVARPEAPPPVGPGTAPPPLAPGP